MTALHLSHATRSAAAALTSRVYGCCAARVPRARPQVFKTVTVFPAATYVAGYGAGVLWTVKSVATNGCQLDFTGVDAILFNEDILITSLTGFFDANTAAQQMNCTAAPLARRLRA